MGQLPPAGFARKAHHEGEVPSFKGKAVPDSGSRAAEAGVGFDDSWIEELRGVISGSSFPGRSGCAHSVFQNGADTGRLIGSAASHCFSAVSSSAVKTLRDLDAPPPEPF